jgi:predicted PurR-regulated permease PerM
MIGSERRRDQKVSKEKPTVRLLGSGGGIQVLFAAVLISVALYFARVVFEPIAFALFGMALVWPFQKALEARFPKFIALGLATLLVISVIFVLAAAIVWSIDDVVHWTVANLPRFQALYERWIRRFEEHGIYIAEGLTQYNAGTFIGLLQRAAAGANYFFGFCVIAFLLITFGLTELDRFKARSEEIASKIEWDVSRTAEEIARKIRKYMLIRTLASALTGLAVFAFTISIGLELAIAWAIISFVLNYIPYLGPLIAVGLPVIFASVQFESWQMVIIIFGGLYLIQFLIGNYLEPIIAGKALAISPLVMLVAFFFWAFLWGLPGAFIGIPITVALLTICEQNPSYRWVARLLSASD